MKLFKGENTKVLQNPSFYFVLILIVISILMIGFYFKPNYTINYLDFEDKTYDQIMLDFNIQYKSASDKKIYYVTDMTANYKYRINAINKLSEDISNSVKVLDNFKKDPNQTTRENLSESFDILINDFMGYTESKNPYCYLIYSDLYSEFSIYLKQLNQQVKDFKISNEALFNYLSNRNFTITINRIEENLYNFNISDETIQKVENNIQLTIEYLQNINSNISNNYNNSRDIDELKKLINQYYVHAETLKRYVENKFIVEGISVYTDMQISNFYGFEDVNLYEIKEENLRDEYLIENKICYTDISFVSGITNRTSYTYSVYDFIYSATEFCFVIIVFYLIFHSSYLIAGEYSRGTLKLLSIRPYKRYKVLLSKILSSIFISTFMLLFAFVLSIVFGSMFIKTTIDTNVIMVFNAQNVFVISPTLSVFIYLICKFIELIICSLFFIMVSILIPKEIYAILISTCVTVATFLLKGIITTISIFAFLPNLNISLFKYFGGSSMVSKETLSILVQPPFITIDFYTSVIYIVVLIIAMNIISFKNFKRLDIE